MATFSTRGPIAPAPLLLPLTLTLMAGLSAGCHGDDDGDGDMPMPPTGPAASLSNIDTSGGVDGIVDLPASVDDRIEAVFDRYTQFGTPSGGRIHLLSQGNVDDDLLIRTRGLVHQHFRDVEGATLGADKTAALNAAAAHSATFVLFENAAAFNPVDPDVAAFMALFGDSLGSLDASTIVQEASAAYRQPSPAIDPSIAATAKFALVQGIATGMPGFQSALTAATDNATINSIYTASMATPADEVDDEYLALALETYYGLWGHDPNGNGTAGALGEYTAVDRATQQVADPMMFALITDFFRPSHRYSAYLDPSFNGDFEMEFDGAVPYTHRSQYLERVGIRGASTARINGNDLDNVFLGSASNSDFEGGGGNDLIEGDQGTDRVFMSGIVAEYTVTPLSLTVFRVEDMIPNRDGIDTLRGITQIVFTDGTVDL